MNIVDITEVFTNGIVKKGQLKQTEWRLSNALWTYDQLISPATCLETANGEYNNGPLD